MAIVSIGLPRFKELTDDGVPLVGGKLYTYAAGTTTPLATYTDATGTTPNPNPIVLDARGECSLWVDSSQRIKLVLTDADDGVIWSEDGIAPDPFGTPLQESDDASLGDALVAVKRTETGGVARTQHQKNTDLTSTRDFASLADALAAADNGPLVDPDTGRVWLLGGKEPDFSEAGNTLARVLAFDNQGNTVPVGQDQQVNFIGIRNGGNPNSFAIGEDAEVTGYSYYLRATEDSHASSDIYGAIGVVYNDGPGSAKSLYGRGVVEENCTGVVMGGVFGVNTNASANPSNTTILQMTADTVPGTRINYGIWLGSNETTGYLEYGLLLDSKIDVSQAGVQMFARGDGDFLRLKNAAGNVDLFKVNKNGRVQSQTDDAGGVCFLAGNDTSGLQVKVDELSRNAAAGNLVVVSGADGTLFLGCGNVRPLQITGSVVSIDNANGRRLNFTGAGATTVGSAGAASALPANPLGYVTIRVNGSDVKVPYYNP